MWISCYLVSILPRNWLKGSLLNIIAIRINDPGTYLKDAPRTITLSLCPQQPSGTVGIQTPNTQAASK